MVVLGHDVLDVDAGAVVDLLLLLLLLIHDRLLREVERLEVLATLAVAPVYQSEQPPPSRVSRLAPVAVLLYELLDGEVASADPDDDLVLLDLHEDALLAVLVDALRLPLEAHLVSHLEGHLVYEEG